APRQQVRRMGGLGRPVKRRPGRRGMGRRSDLAIEDKAMAKLEASIRSMTPSERNDPRIIAGSRRARIARGSGTQVRDVNELLKQFEAVRKMMKSMTKGGGKKGRRGAFSLPPGLGL